MQLLKKLVHEENGQGMAEYGLIIALVAIVLIVALGTLSGGIGDVFNKIGTKLTGEASKIQ